ncbi:MAG: type II secretion system protein [Kiritimatiellia bacterium]
MKNLRPAGFTLIEVIVAIVLSAIAMAAILPMLDRVFQLSHEPRTTLQDGLSLQAAMDELVVLHEAHGNNLAWLYGNVGTEFRGQTVQNKYYVAFTNGVEAASATNNLLKITLQNPQGERATRLFTVPPL